MPWIHEHQNWPQFTWDSESLITPLAAIRHQQGRLLGQMQSLGVPLQQEANLSTLTRDVITTSAIEGNILEPDAVRSSLARRLGLDLGGLSPPHREVDGIVDVMLDATQQYTQPLTPQRLFSWHAALFPTGYSGMRPITVAAWRPLSAGPMQVVSGPIGRESIHFEAPAAHRVPGEMTAFLDWLEQPSTLDPILKAGIAHLWFITLHPFEDGNGRIARAITDMMLARADQAPKRFYSLSTQIEAERKTYYLQLERQQRSTLKITPWLDWLLGCLGRAIHRAEETLTAVLYKAKLWERANLAPVHPRQRLILNRMLENWRGHMSTSKYAKIAKCSQDTALRDIRDLCHRGIFIQNTSGGRSTSYRLVTAEELATAIVWDTQS